MSTGELAILAAVVLNLAVSAWAHYRTSLRSLNQQVIALLGQKEGELLILRASLQQANVVIKNLRDEKAAAEGPAPPAAIKKGR